MRIYKEPVGGINQSIFDSANGLTPIPLILNLIFYKLLLFSYFTKKSE